MLALGYIAGSYALGFIAVIGGRQSARRVTNTVQPAGGFRRAMAEARPVPSCDIQCKYG